MRINFYPADNQLNNNCNFIYLFVFNFSLLISLIATTNNSYFKLSYQKNIYNIIFFDCVFREIRKITFNIQLSDLTIKNKAVLKSVQFLENRYITIFNKIYIKNPSKQEIFVT